MKLQSELPVYKSFYDLFLVIMKHYRTYKLRKEMVINNLSGSLWNYAYLRGGLANSHLKESRTA